MIFFASLLSLIFCQPIKIHLTISYHFLAIDVPNRQSCQKTRLGRDYNRDMVVYPGRRTRTRCPFFAPSSGCPSCGRQDSYFGHSSWPGFVFSQSLLDKYDDLIGGKLVKASSFIGCLHVRRFRKITSRDWFLLDDDLWLQWPRRSFQCSCQLDRTMHFWCWSRFKLGFAFVYRTHFGKILKDSLR